MKTADSVVAGISQSTASTGRGAPRSARSRILETYGSLIALALLCGVFAIVSPRFATADNLHVILNQSAIPLVIATGLTFVVLMGSIDLSIEGVMAATSIVVALLVANTVNQVSLGLVAIAVGLSIGLAFGLLNGILVAKLRLPSLMVTLGTWFMGLGLATFLYPGAQPTIKDSEFRQLALGKLGGFTYMFFLAVAVLLVAFVVLRWTRFGRMVYGIGPGQRQIELAGVRVASYRVGAFAICAVLASLAAIMTNAQIGAGTPTAGYNQLFPAISAVVIGGTYLGGGRGGVLHTAVGVLIIVVLEDGLLLSGVNPFMQQAVIGVVLVLVVAGATWAKRGKLRIVK